MQRWTANSRECRDLKSFCRGGRHKCSTSSLGACGSWVWPTVSVVKPVAIGKLLIRYLSDAHMPAPYLDETFGSWFARAAANYHTDVRGLASALVSMDGQRLPRHLDLDTSPPEELLAALTRHSALRHSELERLIAIPGGSTLPQRHRDAYCGECLREDRERGIVYMRRAWLDAWTLVCDRHGCVLGRFEPIEYRVSEPPSIKNLFPGPREGLAVHSMQKVPF